LDTAGIRQSLQCINVGRLKEAVDGAPAANGEILLRPDQHRLELFSGAALIQESHKGVEAEWVGRSGEESAIQAADFQRVVLGAVCEDLHQL
jgi:hypothetical protein